MSESTSLDWMLPEPHIIEWKIEEAQIDHYNHVNNVAYVSQLEKVAWSHSNQLGLSIQQYQQLDRGMAISKHLIEYHAAALLNEQVLCATWIVECDKRLKLARRFQFIRQADQVTLLTARTDFVCIALSSGKPKRMPESFVEVYSKACVK
ncbi:acyl-CoA thioesterase [Aliiglaciecola sp. LCG003]|uniref:acyl-CoA thioesterase n=1 Tax=Aliiglaciecola sp. LCG003 TaxID=3053655 RepID=UPI0025741E83|nr:acyl-CoA thioesterase [Aliiglaciecola sp. LCG003]WJG08307.1 acyl-CoA thioesterase [Aliiglaciecola sp. LCG003]